MVKEEKFKSSLVLTLNLSMSCNSTYKKEKVRIREIETKKIFFQAKRANKSSSFVNKLK